MKKNVLLIIGVLFVSTAAIFVKLSSAEPSVIAMYRLGLGGLILLLITVKRKSTSRINKEHWPYFIAGGLTIGLHYLAWFTSLGLTTVTSSTLIITSEPLLVIVLSYIIFKEKVSLKQLLFILLAMVGVLIVTWGDMSLSNSALLGNFLTFVAVILFIFYLFIGRELVKKYSSTLYLAVIFLIAATILLVYNIINGYSIFTHDLYNILVFIGIAIIPNAGQLIFIYLLKDTSPTTIATAILAEPIFATILAITILNDTLYINQILGGIVIIVSVLLYLRYDDTINTH